jgi:hypothetical protein
VEKKLILRGVLSGAIAGLLAFGFARIFAESSIQKAIDYEDGRDAAQQALDHTAVPAHSEVFTRTIQANIGLGAGMVLFGVAMGALFAVIYAVCLGRTGGLLPRSLSLLLAGGGFLGFYLVPFLKYPANPPSIGHEDTIKARSSLYLLMVFCSLVLLLAAVWLGRLLRDRLGNWTAALVAGAAFVVAVGVVMLILPSFGELSYNRAHFGHFATETPQPLRDAKGNIVYPGFPADVLFNFRLYSVAAQAVLWSALGLVFAPMADRLLGGRRTTGSHPVLV